MLSPKVFTKIIFWKVGERRRQFRHKTVSLVEKHHFITFQFPQYPFLALCGPFSAKRPFLVLIDEVIPVFTHLSGSMKAFVIEAKKNLQLDIHEIKTLEISKELKMCFFFCHFISLGFTYCQAQVQVQVG